MENSRNVNMVLGVATVLFAMLVFIWVPLDTATGIVEKVRRKVLIGDSLAPILAGTFILLGGLLLLLFERNAPEQPRINWLNLKFVVFSVATLSIGLLIMRYAGPIAVSITNVLTGSELEYRLLRSTVPWKYGGFFLGGSFAIGGVITLSEGHFRVRTLMVAICATLAMIAVYDLPFDDLLLPPNGDV